MIFFKAPATLRIPTSLARFSLLAVDRFMKLMHAISKINTGDKTEYFYPFYSAANGYFHFQSWNIISVYSLDKETGLFLLRFPPECVVITSLIFALAETRDVLGFSNT